MDVRKGMLWYLVNGAVELSWFLGWAMFCSLMTMHRPFPFFETIVAFALAGFLTHLATGKGWMIVSILVMEMLGLIGAALLVIHGMYYGPYPLLEGDWLVLFFAGPRDVSEGIILALNLFLIMVLWAGGVTLALRPKGYFSACNRFDLGFAAFFALFVIKLVALTRGEAMTEDSLSLLFVFPFFLFGLLSIGMERTGGAASKAFLPGYRGIGVIASFVAAALLGAGGLLLFFLPGLIAAAQMGYRAIAVVGKPFVPIVIAALRFVFAPRGEHPAAVAAKSSPLSDWDKVSPQTQSGWMEALEKIVAWGFGGLMVLGLIIVSVIVLVYTMKWLLSRTAESGRQRQSIRALFAALWASLTGMGRKMILHPGGYPNAAELYGALVGWARRSGFPHDRGETPLEFGARLNARFPALKPPVDLIIDSYNREVYGETALGDARVTAANSAWRFLRSPRLWPARFRGWFSNSAATPADET